MLLSSDPLELDRLPVEEAGRKAEELEIATDWLARLFDPRSPREFKVLRVLRLAVAALCALGLLVALGSWAFAPKNLARGKPATSSSTMFATMPAGVVDGSKNGTYGFHSAIEDSPWWAVDLGQNYDVTRIKVFGRGDGVNDQSIPLSLEVSTDGDAYRQIGIRAEPFSESDPWVVKTGPLVTRYIRLKTLRHSYLVLGEVEVNGKKAK
jgi:hypothetical protein